MATSAQAGIYNFAEPPEEGLLGKDVLKRFQPRLLDLRLAFARDVKGIFAPVKGQPTYDRPLVLRYRLAAELGKKAPWDGLSPLEKLNLSAYFLYCNMPYQARDLLDEPGPPSLVRQHPDNFLLLANTATTYYNLGEFDRALFYQQQVLESWPADFAKLSNEQKAFLDQVAWSEQDHQFYRRVEEVFLVLLKERAAEAAKRVTPESVDVLFRDDKGQPLRFVNKDGVYEPGKLDKAERAKLHADAVEVVEQVLLWVPNDNRLYWLLGELLLADGDIRTAKVIFNVVKDSLAGSREFREHRFALDRVPTPDTTMPFDPFEKQIADRDNPGPVITAGELPWKSVALIFVMGGAVALFAYWQFQELRRRRQRNLL